MKKIDHALTMDQAWAMALNNHNAGDLKKAIEFYLSFQQLFNVHPAVRPFLGLNYEALTRDRNAAPFIQRSIELYNNLGAAYRDINHLDDAVTNYQKALGFAPDHAEVNYNLGCVLFDYGSYDQAMPYLRIAAYNMSDYRGKHKYAECLGSLVFIKRNADIYDDMVLAIESSWARPRCLTGSALSLLKLDKRIADLIEYANSSDVYHEQLINHKDFIYVISDRLFLVIIKSSFIDDVKIEKFLTKAREGVLYLTKSNLDLLNNDAIFEFSVALSLNSFMSEYAFHVTEEEHAYVDTLLDKIKKTINDKNELLLFELVIVASYRYLYKLDNARDFLDFNYSKSVRYLIDIQIKQPFIDQSLFPVIKKYGSIKDVVSKKVSAQYEENPYPRWDSTFLSDNSLEFINWFNKAHASKITEFSGDGKDELNILIAGCGTGQQSIEVSRQFKRSKCLAVDLSLASLAYAVRKSTEYSIDNIEYMQADILELGELSANFDIIFSSGVLHHLDDPFQGLSILNKLLRPNGLMLIALYSQHARKGINEVRSYLKQNGYTHSVTDIRAFRDDVFSGRCPETICNEVIRWKDFYNISEARDLLFHVMEHQFTIPDIKEYLETLGLKFMGFDLPVEFKNLYKKRFPDDICMLDLDSWNELELDNQHIFAEMYHFWVYKLG